MTSTELHNAFVAGLSERQQRLAIIWACRYLDIIAAQPRMHEYYEQMQATEPASKGGAFQHTEPGVIP